MKLYRFDIIQHCMSALYHQLFAYLDIHVNGFCTFILHIIPCMYVVRPLMDRETFLELRSEHFSVLCVTVIDLAGI